MVCFVEVIGETTFITVLPDCQHLKNAIETTTLTLVGHAKRSQDSDAKNSMVSTGAVRRGEMSYELKNGKANEANRIHYLIHYLIRCRIHFFFFLRFPNKI